ncbi:protein-lysine N-methyltransferase CG9154 [Anastrepha ludens]|uniref:protein-lysine N-methyltransferase CG9154 n=1 Tax=Anastrepha ludens TaxID=28586 RepID=UPI0023B145B8|nr:protein-lysine N-methyltransferase CG9154 [Anastrepha ludens]XP_053959139.1 protein-lysine N-methyltransferase CG9154 [Anastrepha ludens]
MDEEELTLPADTLQILNDFLQEKAQREREELDRIENQAGTEAMFEEDWQLSQFWYSESTKQALGNVIRKLLAEQESKADKLSYRIALLSCPSLYGTVKQVHGNVKIFEFDKRFSVYGDDFVFYDFNSADENGYLEEYKDTFDIIVADPPFLSEECIMKISKIIKKLQKSSTKIIFCSGAIVEPWLTQSLQLKKCSFEPAHERNLGNEFVSYANFELDNYVHT